MSKKDKKVSQEVPKEPEKTQEEKPLEKIKALLARERVLSEDSGSARELYDQSRFGEPKDSKVNYSLVEALYLLEKGKMDIFDEKDKKISFDDFAKLARIVEPNFMVRYAAYKDMRSRGYIVKTALKFGADFRIYDRGIKPGEDHAKWIMYPVHEGEHFGWYDFSGKNRVAHSTRKRLFLAVVDNEQDVVYYEIAWKRP